MPEPDQPKAAAPAGPRPTVLSLNINSKSALYAAFMPFLRHGGIFVPTTRNYALGDEVFMLLSLMDDPAKLPIAGTVVERNINPGQEFRPDSGAMLERPLFVVTDPDHLWLYLDATERVLRRLKVGEEVHFRTPAWPGETFNALVEQV